VVSHADSAEFGSVLGGVVNVVTSLVLTNFTARDGNISATTLRCPREVSGLVRKETVVPQNQFGASVGVRLKFRGSTTARKRHSSSSPYSGFRYSQPASNNLLVPTATHLSAIQRTARLASLPYLQ